MGADVLIRSAVVFVGLLLGAQTVLLARLIRAR